MKTGRSSSVATATTAIVMVLALAWVWGHYESEGYSRPDSPRELVMTTRWSVFGHWPYFESDAHGARVLWSGALLGLTCTVWLAVLARGLLRARERVDQVRRELA